MVQSSTFSVTAAEEREYKVSPLGETKEDMEGSEFMGSPGMPGTVYRAMRRALIGMGTVALACWVRQREELVFTAPVPAPTMMGQSWECGARRLSALSESHHPALA
jgi:hypothetical protein